MNQPIYTWSGNTGPYQGPIDPFNRPQMTAGYMGPRYTGPFNFESQGGLGQLMQLLPLFFSATGNSEIFGQFNPQQNPFDQMQAAAFFTGQQTAAATAAQQDTAAIHRLLGGIQQAVTGRPLTEQQQARNFRLAGGAADMLPMMIQFLGPDLVDRLHGSRGSATVFAQTMHQTLRTAMDPITGTIGYSGRSAGGISSAIFDDLFGTAADVGALRGLSAGQAGMLAEEMQVRGMLGRPLGSLGLSERLARIPRTLSREATDRMARQLPEIQEIMAAGDNPTETQLNAAAAKIRETHRKLLTPGVSDDVLRQLPGVDALLGKSDAASFREALLNLPRELSDAQVTEMLQRSPGVTPEQLRKTHRQLRGVNTDIDMEALQEMPGAETLIQHGDAQRITSRIKGMAGAVQAMREIFGDMGNPNAPMRQLINGLDMLTQGGLATMAPADVEQLVRKTHNLAKQTGIGMEGMMALTGQTANLTDQLGLDRSFAVRLTHQSAAFGAAAGDVLDLSTPTWGARTKEQLILGDAQLRAHAAASPLANQLNMLMKLSDTGVLNPAAGTETEALIAAIKAGEMTFGPNNRSIAVTSSRLREMLQEDAGLSKTMTMSMLMDRQGNQEYAAKYDTDRLTRRIQPQELARRMLRPTIGSRLGSMLRGNNADDALVQLGVLKDTNEFGVMMQEVAQGISEDTLAIGNSTRDAGEQRTILGRSARARLTEAIRRRMPNADEATVTAAVDAALQKTSPQELGMLLRSTTNAAAGNVPVFGSFQGMLDMSSNEVMEQAARRERKAAADGLIQSALSGMGGTDAVRRITDTLRDASPTTPTMDLVKKALGLLDITEIDANDPRGKVLAELLGVTKETMQLDTGSKEGYAEMQKRAAIAKGLTTGGEFATNALNTYGETLPASTRDALAYAVNAGGSSKFLSDLGYVMNAAVQQEDIEAINATTREVEKQRGKLTEKSKEAFDTHVPRLREFAKRLLQDTVSMEQLGQGGLGLTENLLSDTRELMSMAQREKKSVEELLTDPETKEEASALWERSQQHMQEITDRRSFRMVPGKGFDPRNMAREAMTYREKQSLAAAQAFMAQTDPQAQAEDVIDRLIAMTTPEQAARLRVADVKENMLKLVTTGNRSMGLHRAVSAREDLVKMAVEKGVYGEKVTRPEDLTAEQRQQAVPLLEKLSLTGADAADFARLKEAQKSLEGFGDASQTPSQIQLDAMKLIERVSPVVDASPDAQDKELAVTVKGTVKVNEDGTADLDLSGPGLWTQAMKFMGVQ